MDWIVYLLECSDKYKSLYTGITNNLERRLKAHNSKNSKTKFTRTRQPVKLVAYFTVVNKSEALKLEYKIKQLSRLEKDKLCGLKN